MKIFAEKLKELRAKAGLSQAKLAELLGYTQGNISGWESGTVEPKLNAVQSIAVFFHVSADYLLGLSEDFDPKDSSLDNDEQMLTVNYRVLPDDLKKLVVKMTKSLKK